MTDADVVSLTVTAVLGVAQHNYFPAVQPRDLILHVRKIAAVIIHHNHLQRIAYIVMGKKRIQTPVDIRFGIIGYYDNG